MTFGHSSLAFVSFGDGRIIFGSCLLRRVVSSCSGRSNDTGGRLVNLNKTIQEETRNRVIPVPLKVGLSVQHFHRVKNRSNASKRQSLS